ncbi:MAG: type II toxin-antitoxin system RelE/ParE family toxin [Desulfitobacteriaceae bacterium]
MSKNNYSLKFTPKANEDLEQIYSYISGKLFAEIAAENILERLESSIMRLQT